MLFLNEYQSDDPFNSQILDKDLALDLVKLCEFSIADKWSLIYRGSFDGFGSHDFHAKCDGKAKTLTIIKTKAPEWIFGGYTNLAWDSSSQYKSDQGAFIFSLTNRDSSPIKIKIDASRVDYSLYMDPSYGPIFGTQSGNDILIADDADVNRNSWSDLGGNYKHPRYLFRTDEAKTFLAGAHHFQLSEIEVYLREEC